MVESELWLSIFAGQFCGKEDKEKFEIDQKGSGSGNESNFGRNLDAEANLISQCLASSPSNIMNMDHVTMALSLPPGAAASVGGASAGGQRTTSTGSLYDSHVYIKAEPGGKAQTGKRAAASQGGPQKKAPRLDIPETGLMCLPTTNLSNISDGSPGSLVAALGQRTTSTGSLYDSHVYIKAEPGGKAQTGKRAAASQGGPQKKAPRLDIPETGLMCLPTTNLSNISDGSPGSLVAAGGQRTTSTGSLYDSHVYIKAEPGGKAQTGKRAAASQGGPQKKAPRLDIPETGLMCLPTTNLSNISDGSPGSLVAAGGQRTTSTGSLYDSHVYIKAEPGGKAQTGKRAAASQGGPQKKAPRLDIPETGLMCLPTTNLSNISDGSPGSLVAAGGQRTTSTGSLYDSHVYIKAEPGGKAQTGKRAAASQGGPQKKAPRLDIPETGLMCLPTTNLSNISDGSPGSLVAALSANQGGSGDGSPSQLSLQIPLDPTSSSSGLLADHFLTTPTSTLYHNPISPLGDAGQLTWPDSRSPASSVNAAKSAGPNAFPDPKVKGKG
eukprot:CAMPEP_0179421730 /NCGR_PEP_ID=MMETSP0799-20121207/9975_1 /TAXON_ID=46947 /ORGANISM="Geminigera cryophila, Strain CCMP2564" /LENGTH=551 /DNA_ID=CAMNT_0021195663 /DNA_START=314 /DNA_END=1970 /DNA_ORIENTATION=-